jgi:hypothetical protein
MQEFGPQLGLFQVGGMGRVGCGQVFLKFFKGFTQPFLDCAHTYTEKELVGLSGTVWGLFCTICVAMYSLSFSDRLFSFQSAKIIFV